MSLDIILLAMICKIQIVCLGWIFCTESIDLFDTRYYTVGFPLFPYLLLFGTQKQSELSIRKTGLFCYT